jgi:hypothetical protein
MSRARFEAATPATERPQTYALDRAATGIGCSKSELLSEIINHFGEWYDSFGGGSAGKLSEIVN